MCIRDRNKVKYCAKRENFIHGPLLLNSSWPPHTLNPAMAARCIDYFTSASVVFYIGHVEYTTIVSVCSFSVSVCDTGGVCVIRGEQNKRVPESEGGGLV